MNESNQLEVDIIQNMKIISKESLDSQKRSVGFNTLQIRIAKEHLLKPEEPQEENLPALANAIRQSRYVVGGKIHQRNLVASTDSLTTSQRLIGSEIIR